MYHFFQDIYKGLQAPRKYIDSKYFYDAEGDRLFQEIMHSPEYYLTNCELDILSQQSGKIVDTILQDLPAFDVVELGAGDAMKSKYFLKELLSRSIDFTYVPVDISRHVTTRLQEELPREMPGLRVRALTGEYFEMLEKAGKLFHRNKVILFLGANIGNFTPVEALRFFGQMRSCLRKGDIVLTGFDLKKDPRIILAAYNDKAGITRAFNLNLLRRINRELDADFDESGFLHFPVYDPETGACTSYLVSLRDQRVRIGEAHFIHFGKDEPVFTEISQKYSIGQMHVMAMESGFEIIHDFFDSKKWFVDSLWRY